MITLRDLNTLINHLHQANQIFDTEAIIEERKHHDTKNILAHDMRDKYAPRSVVLHHKADQVITLEKKLLQECDTAIVTLEENTIYAARELIAESVYPWINRREPSVQSINDLMSDETFIPYAHGLTEKKKKLLTSGIHMLLLPQDTETSIHSYFSKVKSHSRKDVTITIGDVVSFGTSNIPSLFSHNTEYNTLLVLFRLHVLGLLETT